MIKPNPLQNKLQQLLLPAGITLNGSQPWDPQVHDERFYARVIAGGSMALGEAYMDKWVDIADIEEFFYRALRGGITQSVQPGKMIWPYLRSLLINEQTKLRSKEVATKHYNLHPELYMSFLDPYNQYTCCYFPDGNETLDEAAIKKLHLLCRKMKLCADDKVLDIGCGWGGFAKFAAEHYGCHVTGVSIAEEQITYAQEHTKGLPADFVCADYRDITGRYTKVLCCGMIEHVGYRNYATLMEIVHNCLADDGIFVLQSIGRNDSAVAGDPWLRKYIFPHGQLPSMKQLADSTEGLFVMEDWQNLGIHYYHTLTAWHHNFARNWKELRQKLPQYDERFYRMWTYYLCSCAAAFRAREIQLWQVVYTKHGMAGGYTVSR